MATLKIISNKDCKLYIDQEYICDITANVLHKEDISIGVYLVDVIALSSIETFDLYVEEDSQQFLKRITFNQCVNEQESCKNLRNRSDLYFYNGLARAEVNGLYGYVNTLYEWVIEPEYSKAEHFIRDTAIVGKEIGGSVKLCLIDRSGNNIIGGWFDETLALNMPNIVIRRNNEILIYNLEDTKIKQIYELCGLISENAPIPVSKNIDYKKRYGFIDKYGNEIIPFIYEKVSDFTDSGYAKVQRFGIERYINKEGKICILNTIEEIENNDKRFCLLDDNFEWCGKLETSAPNISFLSERFRLAVLNNGKWGYYYLEKEYCRQNNHLKELIPCIYDFPISDSRYGFVIMKQGNELCIVNLIDSRYIRGDKMGQYVYGEMGQILFRINAEELYPIYYNREYGDIHDFKNLVIKRNGKYGIINREGIALTEFLFNDIYIQEKELEKSHDFFFEEYLISDRNGTKELMRVDGEIISNIHAKDIYRVGNFWAANPKCSSNKYHLFDAKKRVLLIDEFDSIEYGEFKDESRYFDVCISGHDDYIIRNNNLYGVLDKEGKLIIECKYNNILHIGHKGLTKDGYEVILNNKHGIISCDGELVLRCEFDLIEEDSPVSDYVRGYILMNNNKYGYCDVNGSMILECIYDEILPKTLFDMEFVLKKNSKCALFNCNNSIVTNFIYDEIFDEETDYDKCITEKHQCEFRRTYLVRQSEYLGVIDYLGNTLVDCKYDYIRRCSTMTSDMKYRYEVGLNGLHGIIVEDNAIEIELKYQSISDLGFYCNFFDVYIVEQDGKKAIMDRWSKTTTDFLYDEIRIHHNNEHQLIGFTVITNGLTGFVNEHYEEIIPPLYKSIDLIRDRFDNDKILAFEICNTNNKRGIIDKNGYELIPLIFDYCCNECINNIQFICYSNIADPNNESEYEPFTAMNLHNRHMYKLRCTSWSSLSDELEELTKNGLNNEIL